MQLLKVEATPEFWYTQLPESVVPKGVFEDLRTRWVNLDYLHEIAEMPDLKNDDGSVTKRCVLFVGAENYLNIDQSSSFRYIVHGESAPELVKRIEAASA